MSSISHSILSFNASTADRKALASVASSDLSSSSNSSTSSNSSSSSLSSEDLVKVPFQIMPGGRSTLTTDELTTFLPSSDPNILIHASYITRPFSASPKPYTKLNLKNYSLLAKRLGTKNILIHMPSSCEEYEHYTNGIEMICEYICSQDCICHLETNPLTKDLRLELGITKTNAVEEYEKYIKTLFDLLPDKYCKSFRIVVDTAHLFANGFSGEDIIKFLKKHESKIEFIHLNGNKNAMFTRDNHVPMYDSIANKIDHVDEIMKEISKMKKFLIAEDSTVKGTYEEWKEFCKKYGIKIVEYNKIYSI